MNKYIKHLYFVVAVMITNLSLTACRSGKDIIYFQNADQRAIASYLDAANYEIRIKPNDNLLITVSTPKNPQAAEPYNLISSTRNYTSNIELYGYLVDENGSINFPEFGKLHVAGLTKSELINLLQNKLSQNIINPIVNVRFMHYKITVLGEVVRPGSYTVDNEQISLPDALAKAGDMTIYGERRNVLIYRIENGTKNVYHVDMTSPHIFFSEFYYLQQNDIVYVQPNKARVQAAYVNPMLGTYLSVTGLLLTITNILINLLKK